MADKSPIEWTDATWNPIVGCSIVSPGCTNCYAMKMAGRIEAMGGAKHYAGTTKKVNGNTVWTGKIAMAPDHILLQPLAWRAPRRIFVNSMGDLFHEDVPEAWIDKVFAVMALAPQHTFQVLTKRAKRMREYMTERWQPAPAHRLEWPGGDAIDIPAETKGEDREDQVRGACEPFLEKLGLVDTDNDDLWTEDGNAKAMTWTWPLRNVWLGVSAERQQEADERIPDLLETPAAVCFVSAEPLLGPIDFRTLRRYNSRGEPWIDALHGLITRGDYLARSPAECSFNTSTQISPAELPRLDWIIVGGESGPDARPMHPDWPRAIRDQCRASGTPFFFKQWGAWAPGEWSLDLDDRCQFTPLDPAVPVHGLGDHDRAQHRVHWWDDAKVPEGLGSLRMAKKAVGRLLDGVEHNGMPEMREVLAL